MMVEGGVELMCPMDPAAIDDHHDVFAGVAEGGHHLMEGGVLDMDFGLFKRL